MSWGTAIRNSVIGGLWLLVPLACFVPFWSHVFTGPGKYNFGVGFDGMKNYFTVAWHVKHDIGLLSFEGMNHPFGEHIDMPDAIPALSNTLKLASWAFPSLADNTVAAVNLYMVLGIVFCAWLLFLCMRETGLPASYAMTCAIGITAVSPQMFRLLGHYALSSMWCIPLFVLLVLRHERSRRPWAIAGVIAVTLLAVHAIHLYLAAMVAGLLLAYCVLRAWRPATRRGAWQLLSATILPVIVYATYLRLTDHHLGRTKHPTGFVDYTADLEGLTRPYEWVASPFSTFVFGDIGKITQEAQCYLGLGTLSILAVWGFFLLGSRIFKGKLVLPSFPSSALGGLFAASLLLLLFALGVPYKYAPDSWLWNTPVIPQFRSPARMAWAFYYVAGLAAASMVWRWRSAEMGWIRRVGGIAVVLFPALFLYEGIYFQAFFGKETALVADRLERPGVPSPLWDVIVAARAEKARAVIPLPFFLHGAEELGTPYDNASLETACIFSYHTGIPMVATSSSRTSLEEVRESIGVVSPTWYERPFGKRFEANDTFLLLTCGSPLSVGEQMILGRAKHKMRADHYELWTISAVDLFRDERDAKAQECLARAQGYSFMDGSFVSKAGAYVLYEGFEERSCERRLSGTGAYHGPKNEHNVLASIPEDVLDTAKTYVASYWLYNRGPQRCHAFTGVNARNPRTGRSEWVTTFDPRAATSIHGDWSMIEMPFRTIEPGMKVEVVITGHWPPGDSVWVDDLLIRESDVEVTRLIGAGSKQGLLWNGHLIDRVP
jgi:hypothetical protein